MIDSIYGDKPCHIVFRRQPCPLLQQSQQEELIVVNTDIHIQKEKEREREREFKASKREREIHTDRQETDGYNYA